MDKRTVSTAFAALMLVPCAFGQIGTTGNESLEVFPRRPRCSVYEAADHIGGLASVRGTVREVYRSPKGIAVLAFGGRYPDHVFSIILADARDFGNVNRFKGSTIEVRGFIREFRGKPEIVLSSRRQILLMEMASDQTNGGMGGP